MPYYITSPQIQLSPQGRPELGHRCGKCSNPFTRGREDCPNAPIPVERFTSDDDTIWSEDD